MHQQGQELETEQISLSAELCQSSRNLDPVFPTVFIQIWSQQILELSFALLYDPQSCKNCIHASVVINISEDVTTVWTDCHVVDFMLQTAALTFAPLFEHQFHLQECRMHHPHCPLRLGLFRLPVSNENLSSVFPL